MNPNRTTDWRDAAVVEVPQAAAMLGRSIEWVEHAVERGVLVAHRLRPRGPRAVCVSSLLELMDGLPDRPAPQTKAQTGQYPRLVWSNPML